MKHMLRTTMLIYANFRRKILTTFTFDHVSMVTKMLSTWSTFSIQQ